MTCASVLGIEIASTFGGPELDDVGTVVLGAEDHDAVLASADHLPQSSSASRFTAAQAGFFILSQSGDRLER
jgi:hypothetical protein